MKNCSIIGLALSAIVITTGVRADMAWQSATDYVDELQATTTDGVCIAIAAIDGASVTQHIAGTCDAKSLFQIGSITKTFTGILLADAILSERLSFDSTLDDVLGERVPRYEDKSITLLDLATHTSGLPRLPDNLFSDGTDMSDPYLHYGETDLLAFLSSHELAHEPGTHDEYSNLGMGLLGHILAGVYDQPYANVVGDIVTGPLGLSDTIIAPNAEQVNRVLDGHTATNEVVPNWQFDALAGAGALYSSLDDMVAYVKANQKAPDGLLGKRLQLSHGEQRAAPALGGTIGLAWIRWSRDDRVTIWHNGGTAGHRSFIGFTPATGRGAVVLANASLSVVDAIGAQLLGSDNPLPPITKPITAEAYGDGVFADYLGSYDFTPAFKMTIATDGAKLFGQATGQPRFTMIEVASDRYRIDVVAAEIGFNRDDDGEVASLTLYQNGVEQIARKSGVEIERETVAVSTAELDRYVGKYRLAPTAVFDVTRDGTQLKVRLTGQPSFPVYPKSTTRFYYEVVPAELEFHIDPDAAQASGLTLYQNGVHEAPRID